MPSQSCFLLVFALFCVALPTISRAAPILIEGAWYNKDFPVPVMHLEGGIEDVAREHGLLAAGQPNGKTTLEFLASRVATKVKNSWIALFFYRHFIRNVMVDHIPDRYRTAYEGLGHALGLSNDTIYDAVVLPDAALRAVSYFYKADIAPLFGTGFGCTSIIWNSGPAAVLHGRNLDYEGVGAWDENQVILHVVPKEGLAHVAVTALGVHAPGITAFNEAGLTLSMHQLTFDDTQASGTPMPVISAEVIRNARTIDDAIAIIKSFPRAGGWAYVLSQDRDRAVVETSAHDVAIRRSSEPFFFQTNHVFSPALAKHQIYYSPGSWLDSFERANRLQNFRASSAGHSSWASPEEIALLLGDHAAGTRVAGGTIAKLDNIQSVIMDAPHRTLWIAVGNEKHAPNEGKYIGYHWSDLRSANPPELIAGEVPAPPQNPLRLLLRQGMAHERDRPLLLKTYLEEVRRESVSGVPPHGTWSGLYLHVWNELKSAPGDDALARDLLGVLDLAMRDPELVENAAASNSGTSAISARYRLALGHFYRGRLLDLLGHRGEALYEYMVAQRNTPFERLQKLCREGLKKPYKWPQTQKITIDWAGIDLFVN